MFIQVYSAIFNLQSVSIKNLQIKFLPLSAPKKFTLRTSRISSMAHLENQVSTAIKSSVLPPDN